MTIFYAANGDKLDVSNNVVSNRAPLGRAGDKTGTTSAPALGSVNVCLVRKRPFSSRVQYSNTKRREQFVRRDVIYHGLLICGGFATCICGVAGAGIGCATG